MISGTNSGPRDITGALRKRLDAASGQAEANSEPEVLDDFARQALSKSETRSRLAEDAGCGVLRSPTQKTEKAASSQRAPRLPISLMIALLNSEQKSEAEAFLCALSEAQWRDWEVNPKALETLRSELPRASNALKIAVAKAFADIAATDNELCRSLLDQGFIKAWASLLPCKDPTVSETAAAALGKLLATSHQLKRFEKLGAYDVTVALTVALQHPSEKTREWALYSLSLILANNKQYQLDESAFLPALPWLIGMLRYGSDRMCVNVSSALHKFFVLSEVPQFIKSARLAPDLMEFIRQRHPCQIAAFAFLGLLARDSDAIKKEAATPEIIARAVEVLAAKPDSDIAPHTNASYLLSVLPSGADGAAERRQAIIDAGAVPLLQAIASTPQPSNAKANAMVALRNLLLNNTLLGIISEVGSGVAQFFAPPPSKRA